MKIEQKFRSVKYENNESENNKCLVFRIGHVLTVSTNRSVYVYYMHFLNIIRVIDVIIFLGVKKLKKLY